MIAFTKCPLRQICPPARKMKYFSLLIFTTLSSIFCGCGLSISLNESASEKSPDYRWISLYESGSELNSVHRLVLSKNNAAVTIGEIENQGTNEKWKLPIQTDKLTYPLWKHLRFTPRGERALLPVELPLGCLMSKNGVKDTKGRDRCFALVVIDCRRRAEIGRESISSADVIKFGWLEGR